MDTVEEVLRDPKLGQLKKGDLEGFRVHKFTMGRQLTLIAYRLKTILLSCTRLVHMKTFIRI